MTSGDVGLDPGYRLEFPPEPKDVSIWSLLKRTPLWGSKIKRLPRDEGYLYVVECQTTFRVKVGFASGLRSRFHALQSGCPTTLILIGYVTTVRSFEAKAHEALAAFHHRGEWFDGKARDKALDLLSDGLEELQRARGES